MGLEIHNAQTCEPPKPSRRAYLGKFQAQILAATGENFPAALSY